MFLVLATGVLVEGVYAVPACDSRIAIDNPARHPFNTVATIRYDKDCIHSLKAYGTGALVGPHMLLTAGHVVYNRGEGKKNQTCNYIQPAAYLDEASGDIIYPYGERTISDTKYKKTNNKYVDQSYSSVADVDYGAIHIVCPFEDINTYMPMVFDYRSGFVNMSGYPIEDLPDSTRGGEQWRVSGNVTSTFDRRMVYDARSTGGASGAPVWEFQSGSQTRRLIAVNRGHSSQCNGLGPRLVWQNEGLINTWLDWQPTLSEKVAQGCAKLQTLPITWSGLLTAYKKNPRLKLFKPKQLRLVKRPRNIRNNTKANFRVYQYIQYQKFVWEEFLTNSKKPKSTRYIRLIKPVKKWLNVRESQILLSASATWVEQKPSGKYQKKGPVGKLVPIPMPKETKRLRNDKKKDNSIDMDFDESRKPQLKEKQRRVIKRL